MADPTTVSELIDWFEREFMCMVGPARSYFEIPMGPPDEADRYPKCRMVYQTWAVKCPDVVACENLLVGALFDDFKNVPREPDAQTVLFWRLPQKIELTTELRQVYGDTLATQEVVEDGLAPIPDGAILDPVSCCWCVNAGTERIWTLRTRLCIPALRWNNHPPMMTCKAEGAETLMIGVGNG